MLGVDILARSLCTKAETGWQYHPRSDRHSKVACWAILFDVLNSSGLLAAHVRSGKVVFGINHEMRDFEMNRKKNLDLVLCTPRAYLDGERPGKSRSIKDLVAEYGVVLDSREGTVLDQLPALSEGPAGAVLMALEAKAAMTAHVKALPRLHDELDSSHLAIHGAADRAIAAGYVLVNGADRYLRPDKGVGIWATHKQPQDTQRVVDKISQIRRRAKVGDKGFDAIGLTVLSIANDGSPVSVVRSAPAPAPGDNFHYDMMINRIVDAYGARFSHL